MAIFKRSPRPAFSIAPRMAGSSFPMTRCTWISCCALLKLWVTARTSILRNFTSTLILLSSSDWTMVAPGFLQTPQIREWLNGLEPAWTLLEFDSFNALRHEPSRDGSAIRLAANISDADLAASAVASNALRLLRKAEDSGGLKLTTSGNLSRAVVAEMGDAVKWP